MDEDRRRTIHELADTVGISYEVCQEILTCAALLLHHDNAPTHVSPKTAEFVTNNNMVMAPQPPYSPDLASCDFDLFPKLKMNLKGRRFERVADIQRESQAVLDSIKGNGLHRRDTFSRRLYLRRWQPKFSKLTQHLFFDLVREVSNSTSWIVCILQFLDCYFSVAAKRI
jgi:transposase